MKSIFASKLYKASSRKGRIQAALIAPSNLALVQQLAENLDDTYKTPENLGQEPKEDENADGLDLSEFASDEKVDPSKDLMTMNDIPSHSGSFKGSSNNEKDSSDALNNSLEGNDVNEFIPESPGNDISEDEPEPAEASTKIKATTLEELGMLKSTLNSRQDLSGVTRIAEKENEIWIYYNDDINLNNIMTNVIEYLMNNGYEHFEFNRLARSDNAIVFVRVIETT